MSKAKRKPHEMAVKLAEPCVCGSLWSRPGIDFNEEKADLIDLCAGCKRRVVDGRAIVQNCVGCGEPVIDAVQYALQLPGGLVRPIHATKSCVDKARDARVVAV